MGKKLLISVFFTAVLAWPCVAQIEGPKAGARGVNVIAVVHGEKVTETQKDNLNGIIVSSLFRQFAKENKIEPTEEELDSFVLKAAENEMKQQVKMEAERKRLMGDLKNASLPDEERKKKTSSLKTIESILTVTQEMKERTKGMEGEMRRMKRQMAVQIVKSWKINKALYEKYRGRVIFQQAGAEPLDAYRDFLKEQEKKGAFQIIDKQYEPDFWRYYTNDAMHTFYDEKEGNKFINTPWWMMD